MIAKLSETVLKDGQGNQGVVRPGDKVVLSTNFDDPEFMRSFLGGDGPYTISWIGKWPCGRVMLYVKHPHGEPGAYASHFRCIE